MTPSPNDNGSPNSPPQPYKPTSPPPTHQRANSAAQTQSGATTSTTSSVRYPQSTTKSPGHEDNYAVRKELRYHSTTTSLGSSTKARIDWSTAPVRRICCLPMTALLMVWSRGLGLWLLLLYFWPLLRRWFGYLGCGYDRVDRRDAFAVFRGRGRRLKMQWKAWMASVRLWSALRKSESILRCGRGFLWQKQKVLVRMLGYSDCAQ
jgi:hypothetical protein